MSFKYLFFASWHLSGEFTTSPWPSVDFINVLQAAFAHVDSKSIKRCWGFYWILTLSGSTCVKAVHRTLMKMSPNVALIATFSVQLPLQLLSKCINRIVQYIIVLYKFETATFDNLFPKGRDGKLWIVRYNSCHNKPKKKRTSYLNDYFLTES